MDTDGAYYILIFGLSISLFARGLIFKKKEEPWSKPMQLCTGVAGMLSAITGEIAHLAFLPKSVNIVLRFLSIVLVGIVFGIPIGIKISERSKRDP
jgi:hypothetical protein